jgi:hypothetical protein
MSTAICQVAEVLKNEAAAGQAALEGMIRQHRETESVRDSLLQEAAAGGGAGAVAAIKGGGPLQMTGAAPAFAGVALGCTGCYVAASWAGW